MDYGQFVYRKNTRFGNVGSVQMVILTMTFLVGKVVDFIAIKLRYSPLSRQNGEYFTGSIFALRAREKITSHFRIPSSGCLWPIFDREILERALLFLRFRSLRCDQIQPKSGRQNVNLFLRKPLFQKKPSTYFYQPKSNTFYPKHPARSRRCSFISFNHPPVGFQRSR